MKKRLFVLLLALAVSTSMIACGADDKPPVDSDSGTKVEDGIESEEDQTDDDSQPSGSTDDENTDSETGDAIKPDASKPSGSGSATSKPGSSSGSTTSKPGGGASSNKPSSGSNASLSGKVEDIVANLYKSAGMTDLNTAATAITSENMGYYLGVSNLKLKQGVGFEPMMSSIAHSVVLIELEAGQDVSKAKSDIKKNVDGYKWICVGVEPENILVDNIGNFVLLVMDENAKSIMDAFKALV